MPGIIESPFKDLLNTKNLLTEYLLIIQTGTAELLQFPERKEFLTNDWREENGQEYDLALPTFKDKEVTLNCAIVADDDTLFWSAYNAFFAELTKAGWQDLYIHDHSKTYSVFYKKSQSFKKASKRLKNVEKILVKFQITLQVKY
ncbi:MAG: hypothetical protein LC112_07800 [Flavobacteriales bacterium]|nr:hypothetical protein [Flavobacteriales bacterium]